MTRYLLAAEADQIQDFVFRAARLRAVVGGSQFLSRFCVEAPRELGVADADAIVADGGTFRIRFDDEAGALRFGRDLADLYRILADGTLTVGTPVPYDDGDFWRAHQEAMDSLRRAKHRGDVPAMPAHLPLLAFCASCGIGLADAHESKYSDERPNYLCGSCGIKADESDRSFLATFAQEVSRLAGTSLACPIEAAKIADLDARRCVAYLAADGNGMGRLFGRCRDERQLQRLSDALTATLRASLATPCPSLLERVRELKRPPAADLLPVMPLILGGDDAFALLPAPWAIDFARAFCETFESLMADAIAALNLAETTAPTVSAAVVICKVNYPHRLARQRADVLLAKAKHLAKGSEPSRSVLAFEVVSGNSLPTGEDEPDGDLRPSLMPYTLDDVATLLDQRRELSVLGNKRVAQLRSLYDDLPDRRDELSAWERRLNDLLDRIDRDPDAGQATRAALQAMGDRQEPAPGHWRWIQRRGWNGSAHGLPDLIDVWRYAFALETPRLDYREES